MRTGVVLQSVDPPGELRSWAREIDRLGYDDLWITDSSLHTRSCWVALALAAEVAPRLRIGTAVTNPLTRHPGVTAASAATLAELSDGHFVLGVGAGDRPLEALGLRPAPVAVVAELVDDTRRLLRGEHIDGPRRMWSWQDAHLRFPAPAVVPIHLAASGPQMLELAGEIADGVILLAGLFFEGVTWALERIQAGADGAGRPRPEVIVFAYGAIDDEHPERALEAGRSIAAWFPQTAPAYCDLAGLDPAVAAEVRARYQGGEFQEAAGAAQLLPDDFVRKMALAGTTSDAAEHLRDLQRAGVDGVAVFPLGEGRHQTVEAFLGAVRAVGAGAPGERSAR